jgi:DNA repair protein RadC
MKAIKDMPEHSRPREVFADVIADRAAAVISAHNHPGMGLRPQSN